MTTLKTLLCAAAATVAVSGPALATVTDAHDANTNPAVMDSTGTASFYNSVIETIADTLGQTFSWQEAPAHPGTHDAAAFSRHNAASWFGEDTRTATDDSVPATTATE